MKTLNLGHRFFNPENTFHVESGFRKRLKGRESMEGDLKLLKREAFVGGCRPLYHLRSKNRRRLPRTSTSCSSFSHCPPALWCSARFAPGGDWCSIAGCVSNRVELGAQVCCFYVYGPSSSSSSSGELSSGGASYIRLHTCSLIPCH